MQSVLNIEVREAPPDEWPQIADVTWAANDQYASAANPTFWKNYEKSTRSTVLNDKSITRLVALYEGEIVGSVLYCPPYEIELSGKLVKNPHPEMRLLSVLPAWRNRGIAGALIDECEKRARSAGEAVLTLHTTELMQVAKAMYERRGYTRFSEIDFEPAPGFTVWGFKKALGI